MLRHTPSVIKYLWWLLTLPPRCFNMVALIEMQMIGSGPFFVWKYFFHVVVSFCLFWGQFNCCKQTWWLVSFVLRIIENSPERVWILRPIWNPTRVVCGREEWSALTYYFYSSTSKGHLLKFCFLEVRGGNDQWCARRWSISMRKKWNITAEQRSVMNLSKKWSKESVNVGIQLTLPHPPTCTSFWLWIQWGYRGQCA